MEEARVLLWHRDKLKLSIITDQFLQAVFDHILGRDVVKKLMQVSVRYLLFFLFYFASAFSTSVSLYAVKFSLFIHGSEFSFLSA
jgi:hypothetical protein